MDLPVSRTLIADLRIVPSAASTNSDLVALAADRRVASFTAVATLDQTAGRGRLDRAWISPPGAALALSVLVRGAVGGPRSSWIPLIAGISMTESLEAQWPGRFALKWPNDVLLDGLKVCGILVEVAADTDAVIGCGLNLHQTQAQLPVPTATSLALAGIPVDDAALDRIVAGYLERLRDELERRAPINDLRDRVAARCTTLGHSVRVELPDHPPLEGIASGIDLTGRLEVLTADGATTAVAVGDVIHVRAV